MKRAPKSVGSTPIYKPYPLILSVQEVLNSYRLIPYGGSVIVGVSGGPDSTALLDILYHLRHELGFRMAVAHFNHRIRREASDDELFVGRLAMKYQVPFIHERAEHKPPVTGSIEEWARNQRYDFFMRTSKKFKADGVVLAHTADDLAETVLMRIIRGAGLHGLKGMGEKRTVNTINILRPMLAIRKKEILGYLKARKLEHCFDKTNAESDFFRNKIRLKLLPILEKGYNNNMTGALVNLSRSAADDYDFLYHQALLVWPRIVIRGTYGIVVKAQQLRSLHPALRRMIIRLALERIKGDLNQINFDHIERVGKLLDENNGRVELPAGFVAEKTKDHLRFRRPRSKT